MMVGRNLRCRACRNPHPVPSNRISHPPALREAAMTYSWIREVLMSPSNRASIYPIALAFRPI